MLIRFLTAQAFRERKRTTGAAQTGLDGKKKKQQGKMAENFSELRTSSR